MKIRKKRLSGWTLRSIFCKHTWSLLLKDHVHSELEHVTGLGYKPTVYHSPEQIHYCDYSCQNCGTLIRITLNSLIK